HANPRGGEGVATAANRPACPAGNTVTAVTPAPPGSVNLLKNGNKSKLAGVWTVTGSTTFTVHCSGGATPLQWTVKVVEPVTVQTPASLDLFPFLSRLTEPGGAGVTAVTVLPAGQAGRFAAVATPSPPRGLA